MDRCLRVSSPLQHERGTEDCPAFAEWLLSAAQMRRQLLRALSIRQHTRCLSSTYFPFPFSLVTAAGIVPLFAPPDVGSFPYGFGARRAISSGDRSSMC